VIVKTRVFMVGRKTKEWRKHKTLRETFLKTRRQLSQMRTRRLQSSENNVAFPFGVRHAYKVPKCIGQ